MGPYQYSHKKEDLKRGLMDSLKALGTEKVDLFYLHAPDVSNVVTSSIATCLCAPHRELTPCQHNTPYAETLEAVNDLYRAGHFFRFGLSNYSAWEVAQICELCDRHGWKKPDVYQGSYNALQRSVEPELFPCLRAYGIAFYSFSPLAGGLLTGKYERDTVSHESGSRYDPARFQGKNFRGRYWNDAYFTALNVLRNATEAHDMSLGEAALRWSSHHSAMKRECGDAVVIGASSATQLEENLRCLEGGPLPEDVVEAFQKAWTIVKGVCVSYC